MEAYELIDLGDGARLERFGEHVTDRPHAGALAPRREPSRWADADLRFDRDAGWSTRDAAEARPWIIEIDGLSLELRPTEAGQVGLFPEHRLTLDWLTDRISARVTPDGGPPEVLHLFAYTGLATLAMASAGAAVAHVDASRPTVAWARANASLSRLADRPIRWLVDDARDLVARELRRGRGYDGIVLDPPSYGHGPSGTRRWQIGVDLHPLLAMCARLLADDGFLLLTAHSGEFAAAGLGLALEQAAGARRRDIESGELTLASSAGGHADLGAFARWDRSP